METVSDIVKCSPSEKTSFMMPFVRMLTLVILVFSVCLDYYYGFTETTNIFASILLIIISVAFVFITRNNLPMFVLSLFILYVNYSISVGEFLTTVAASCPLSEVGDFLNYGIALRSILLFTATLFICYKPRLFILEEDLPKQFAIKNDAIFWGLIFILFFIFFNGINPTARNSYSVSITTYYEYSRILFLFAFFASGGEKRKQILLMSLAFCYIFQDMYWGGRVTSLQLLIFIFLTNFLKAMNIFRTLVLSFLGLILFVFVGFYRTAFSFSFPFSAIIKFIKGSYFVFDTATYSFYASATHVAASHIVPIATKINSFLHFLGALFLGSGSFDYSSVTTLSNDYYSNIGGGILPTHFYFWGSFPLVILGALFLILLLNNLQYNKKLFGRLIFLSIIVSVPRWYLYGPIVLIRGSLILPTICYLIFMAGHLFLKKCKPYIPAVQNNLK